MPILGSSGLKNSLLASSFSSDLSHVHPLYWVVSSHLEFVFFLICCSYLKPLIYRTTKPHHNVYYLHYLLLSAIESSRKNLNHDNVIFELPISDIFCSQPYNQFSTGSNNNNNTVLYTWVTFPATKVMLSIRGTVHKVLMRRVLSDKCRNAIMLSIRALLKIKYLWKRS